MADFEFVSVAEAAVKLGISPTTVRDRIRAGVLEAERVSRPQGTVFLVKLPVHEQVTPEDEKVRTDTRDATHDQERIGADVIAAAIAPLEARLVVQDALLVQKDETISVQAATIADLREERGTLAARTEHERARAVRAESERDAVRVDLDASRVALRRWWLFFLAAGGLVLLGLLLAWPR